MVYLLHVTRDFASFDDDTELHQKEYGILIACYHLVR